MAHTQFILNPVVDVTDQDLMTIPAHDTSMLGRVEVFLATVGTRRVDEAITSTLRAVSSLEDIVRRSREQSPKGKVNDWFANHFDVAQEFEEEDYAVNVWLAAPVSHMTRDVEAKVPASDPSAAAMIRILQWTTTRK